MNVKLPVLNKLLGKQGIFLPAFLASAERQETEVSTDLLSFLPEGPSKARGPKRGRNRFTPSKRRLARINNLKHIPRIAVMLYPILLVSCVHQPMCQSNCMGTTNHAPLVGADTTKGI